MGGRCHRALYDWDQNRVESILPQDSSVMDRAGILTVVPALADVLTSVFGLGFIVWFAWVGIVTLRSDPAAA